MVVVVQEWLTFCLRESLISKFDMKHNESVHIEQV